MIPTTQGSFKQCSMSHIFPGIIISPLFPLLIISLGNIYNWISIPNEQLSFYKINVGSPDFKDLLVLADVHGRLLALMGARLSFDLIYNS